MIAVSTTIKIIVEEVTNQESTQGSTLSEIKAHFPAVRDHEHVKRGA
jgi:hypothetical protein